MGDTVAGSVNGMSGNESHLLRYPYGVVLNADETLMYVTDDMNTRVQRFRVL
jgi:sugar lactone lactonase YvrE